MNTKHYLLSALLALPLALVAEPNTTPLKSGDLIPDVALKSAAGEPVALKKLVSEKPSVLIFYRGGWCPYCTRHLQALGGIEKDLVAAGYQLLAISPDQPSKLREHPDLKKVNYTLLSDSSMEAAKSFGIAFEVDATTREKYKEYGIDLEAASGESRHLLPYPAVFVVDKKGVILFDYVNKDYKVRLEPEKIKEAALGAL